MSFSMIFYLHPLETGSHDEPGGTLTASSRGDMAVPILHSTGITHTYSTTLDFLHGFWGSRLRSSWWYSRGSYLRSHLPSPVVLIY